MRKVKEVWKTIEDHENYSVSNLGRIKNQKGQVLKVYIYDGYSKVSLYIKNKQKGKLYLVHKLVLKAFVGDVPKGKEVHHVNHNPLDNRLSNLKYVTHSENVKIAYASGRKQPPLKKGEENGRSKLKSNEVLEIRRLCNHIPRSLIAKIFKISRVHVYYIETRQTWKHI